MNKKLNRKINFLIGYAFLSTWVLAFVIFSSFVENNKESKNDELTVKRLNIIGEDGSLRMVLSNENRQHSGRMDGKDLPKRKRPAGIIFFNNDGDESGGLIMAITKEGELVNSGMSFTMDNYRNDQVIQLLNTETYENGKARISRGLMFNEYPIGASLTSFVKKTEELKRIKDPVQKKEKEKELQTQEAMRRRLFVGRNDQNENGLFLYDPEGKPKMKIFVDQHGDPRVELIDKEGKTINILSELE